ncbi:hypothetical protein BV25DRAFT_572778 [Artomyces pyxidatus]|uniref:Uncharacterized protein n=1 Tax=Artomyces pyxidatus TaxID=48021 RepID=A0ACB8TJ59_9AGAM|nr:hypothetical protein BV25DRAFT_572778 [Artomyces pyxidatus]
MLALNETALSLAGGLASSLAATTAIEGMPDTSGTPKSEAPHQPGLPQNYKHTPSKKIPGVVHVKKPRRRPHDLENHRPTKKPKAEHAMAVPNNVSSPTLPPTFRKTGLIDYDNPLLLQRISLNTIQTRLPSDANRATLARDIIASLSRAVAATPSAEGILYATTTATTSVLVRPHGSTVSNPVNFEPKPYAAPLIAKKRETTVNPVSSIRFNIKGHNAQDHLKRVHERRA